MVFWNSCFWVCQSVFLPFCSIAWVKHTAFPWQWNKGMASFELLNSFVQCELLQMTSSCKSPLGGLCFPYFFLFWDNVLLCRPRLAWKSSCFCSWRLRLQIYTTMSSLFPFVLGKCMVLGSWRNQHTLICNGRTSAHPHHNMQSSRTSRLYQYWLLLSILHLPIDILAAHNSFNLNFPEQDDMEHHFLLLTISKSFVRCLCLFIYRCSSLNVSPKLVCCKN